MRPSFVIAGLASCLSVAHAAPSSPNQIQSYLAPHSTSPSAIEERFTGTQRSGSSDGIHEGGDGLHAPAEIAGSATPLSTTPSTSRAVILQTELTRLQTLEEQVSDLQNLVRLQKRLVKGLASDEVSNLQDTIEDCDDVSCIAATILDHVKHNPHLSPLTDIIDSHIELQEHYASHIASPAASFSSLNITTTCRTTEVAHGLANQSSGNSIHMTLSLVLAFVMCFFLVLAMLLYRAVACYSPRRRAIRAACREERQTRRAYRRLACRQAWSDWWTKGIFRRHNDPRKQPGDYEEKRALFTSEREIGTSYYEEELLQEEIRGLREAHGIVSDLITSTSSRGSTMKSASPCATAPSTSDADETMSDLESLPSYRSRTSSGTPPSYRETDSIPDLDEKSASTSASRTRSSIIRTRVPSMDLMTPDSSVVAISPRQSYETLRSEMTFI